MARTSFLLALIVAAMAMMFSNAFAPAQQYGVRTPTQLQVNIKVDVGDGEPIESALRRFKREVNKSGHLMELRHKRYFENAQQKKIRKVKEGRMRKKFERINRRRIAQRT